MATCSNLVLMTSSQEQQSLCRITSHTLQINSDSSWPHASIISLNYHLPYPLFLLLTTPYSDSLSIKFNWSYNFRPPSFNEMYYLNYGNQDLKPERANSLNITLSSAYLKPLIFNASFFHIITHNKIISHRKSTLAWTAKNIGKSLSYGIELEALISLFNNKLQGSFAYTLLSATDQSPNSATKGKELPYIPKENLSMTLSYKVYDITLSSSLLYNSYRYSLFNNLYSDMLPRYFVVNAFIQYDFSLFTHKLALRFDCNNIFDKHYQVIINYPMPARAFRFSLIFNS